MEFDAVTLLREGRAMAETTDGSTISSARKARARRRYIAAPTGLILVPGVVEPHASVQLAWTAAVGVSVSGYKVLRNGVEVADVSDVTYLDEGLTPSTLYAYDVYAYNGYHGTSGKVTGQVTTDVAPP